MVRKLACLTLVLAGLSGCASYEQGYRDGYWRGAANEGVVKGKDGSVYAPAEDGYGDYYYREPAPEPRDPYWAYTSLYSPLLWSYGYGPYWRHPAWSYGVSYRHYRPYSYWSLGYHSGFGWYPWSYSYGWGYGGWYDPWPYRRDWYGHHYPRPRPRPHPGPGPSPGPGPGPGTGGPDNGDPLERFGPTRRAGIRLPPVQPPLVDGDGGPRLGDEGKRPGISGGRPMPRPPVDVDAGRDGRPYEVGNDEGTRTGRVIREGTFEANGDGVAPAPAPRRDTGIPLPARGFRGMPETDRGDGRMPQPRMQAPRPEPRFEPRPVQRPEPRIERPVDRGFRGMPEVDRGAPRMQQPRMEQPRMEQPRMEQPRMAPPPAPRMAPPPPPPRMESPAPSLQEE